MNGACGLVMQKMIHDRLSCESMNVACVDDWSNDKSIIHPTRSEINTHTFTTAGKTCLNRLLLKQIERFPELLKRNFS